MTFDLLQTQMIIKTQCSSTHVNIYASQSQKYEYVISNFSGSFSFDNFTSLSTSGVSCESEFNSNFYYSAILANGSALPWYIQVTYNKP